MLVTSFCAILAALKQKLKRNRKINVLRPPPRSFRRSHLGLTVALLMTQSPSVLAVGTGAKWLCEQLADGAWECRASDWTAPEPPAIARPPLLPRAGSEVPAVQTGSAGASVSGKTPTPIIPATDTPLAAESPWSLCEVSTSPSIERLNSAQRAAAAVEIGADDLQSQAEGVSRLLGEVEIVRGDQSLRADRVDYNKAEQTASAEGAVKFNDPGLILRGERAEMDFGEDLGTFQHTEYSLPERHGRGGAAVIRRDGKADLSDMEQVTYTTCDASRNQDDPDWQLTASTVKLEHAEDIGTARNVVLRFKGVPFLYTPYISFPLSDARKSGLLVPSIGNSSDSGFELAMPYYWNIAPNRDATFTPRLLSKRGLQLGAEYRYLQSSGRGEVYLEVLPNDDEYGDHRVLGAYRQQGWYGERWNTSVDLNYVSDGDYFHDLGRTISLTSTTHLERRVDLTYNGDWWSLLGRVHGFQTLDESVPDSRRPYYRLPQLLFNGRLPRRAFGLDYRMRGELVRFEHDDRVTGTRLDTQLDVSRSWENPYSFITPKLGLRYTGYKLDNLTASGGLGPDDAPSRATGLFSLDTGLFFERETQAGGRDLLHTLEPRLFYLYAPKEDQNDIAVFDSGLFDFSFAQLFRENRFTGADRLGDANQITLALSSRLLDPASGEQLLKASIGQIMYFQDREVVLPGQAVETDNSSDLVAEFSGRLGRDWQARGAVQWDPHAQRTEKSVFHLRYQPEARRVLNLAYRKRFNNLEQTDLAFAWPLSAQWSVLGRWNYALDVSRTVDAFAGFEYTSCCWAVRLVGRHYLKDLDSEASDAVLLQLELKGLASIGDQVTKFLERGILGYGRDPLRGVRESDPL